MSKVHDFRKEPIQRELRRMGFSRLEDKNLIEQMAVCVRDHEHFRAILVKVEPHKRTTAYEAFRQHLRFTAKPLDVYLTEAAQAAEAERLPVWDEKNQTVTDYSNYHGSDRPFLEVLAERAIKRAALEQKAKGSLTITCAKCTKQANYPALDQVGAYAAAVRSGWVFKKIAADESWPCNCSTVIRDDCKAHEREIAVCPACPASRLELAHA